MPDLGNLVPLRLPGSQSVLRAGPSKSTDHRREAPPLWLASAVLAPVARSAGLALFLVLVASLGTVPSALAATAVSQERFTNPGGNPYQNILFVAAPGETNRLAASLTPTALELSDAVAIAPLGGCESPFPGDLGVVACRRGSSPGATSFEATLGDGDDVFSTDLPAVAHGGSGADALRAGGEFSGIGVLLSGDSGNDRLVGQDGEDRLDGGSARDQLSGGSDIDTLAGGADDDLLRGESDGDVLRGGAGRDLLDGGGGFDQFFGGNGRDRLQAEDGHTDDVHCQGGDSARLDAVDMLSGHCGRNVRVGAPRAVPVGDLDSVPLALALTSFPGDSLGTGVGCPADRKRPCTGSLLIRDEGRALGRKAFRGLLPGAKRQLTIRVGKAVVDRAGSGDSIVTLIITTRGQGRPLRAVATAGVF